MGTIVQPMNGDSNGATAAPEIFAPSLREHAEPIAKSGFQKRIDKLTREKYTLQAQLRERDEAISQYETLLRKYKAALASARRNRT